MTNIYQTYKYGFVSEGLEPTEDTGSGIIVRYSNQGTDTFEYHTPWDYSLGTADNHAAAAEEAIKHWNSVYNNYFGNSGFIQGLLPDGRYAYMLVPNCLKFDDRVLPLNSRIDNPVLPETVVEPKSLVVAPGMVLQNKETKEKLVARIFTKKYMDNEYEIICEQPHEDGDFSYMCYSHNCRCMQ